ncbi:hypothetical protein [Candidatus Methanomassiliicoccus intestinalis]|uniref:hypothetical protein n=1 Tax=Candidatus Methanomassiliicoccus intestinalis TaxID=1406512 RepID=UPI0037DC22CB
MSLGIAIILSVLVMCIMITAGRKLQMLTKFVYPKDVFSLAFIIGVVICVIGAEYELIPITLEDVYWCVPAMLGYIIGYILGNEQSYQTIEYISPKARYTAILKTVIYEEGEKQYIADQTNVALLKRLLFGIVHELDTQGVKMEFNWDVDAQFKIKMYKRKVCNVERLDTKFDRVGKLKLKRYKTTIGVAVANQISHAELVSRTDALDTLNDTVLTLSNEVIRLKNTVPKRVAKSIIELTRPSYEKTTLDNISNYLNKVKDDAKDSEEAKA